MLESCLSLKHVCEDCDEVGRTEVARVNCLILEMSVEVWENNGYQPI